MIPKNIKREHVLKAIEYVQYYGCPERRKSYRYFIEFSGILYPAKYVLSRANFYANRITLDPESFSGGTNTNNFLTKLGFKIVW